MEIETEHHFLLRCQQHTESRANIYESIDVLVRQSTPAFSMAQLSDDEKVATLLGCSSALPPLLSADLRRRVLSLCSLAVAEWSLRREQGSDCISLMLADE